MKKKKENKELDPFLQELVDEMWSYANAMRRRNEAKRDETIDWINDLKQSDCQVLPYWINEHEEEKS